VHETRYYYGGGLESHLGFLLLYSFLAPRPTLYYPSYAYPSPSYPGGFSTTTGGRGGVTLGDIRRPSTPAPSYEPASRPTMFSGARVGGQAGVGRTKPSGFGRTTVRTSGGRVTGVGSASSSSSSGRSGSLGRSSSSGSG
jgi:hypothetical protein